MAERRRTRSVKDAEDDPDQLAPDEAEEEEFAAEDEEFADDEGGPSGESAEIEEDEHGAGTDGRRGGRKRPAAKSRAALTVKDAAKAALQQVMDLTGKPAESITDVERTSDGWKIGIEVIEDRRIPSSADILATYRAEMDEDGELVSYQRVRRYPRGRGDSCEGS
jgi:Gas vesicle synthesis protein GvpO